MIEKAAILPTGDEIRNGMVLDTDSSEVMRQLVRLNPCVWITRYPPLLDNSNDIAEEILSVARENHLVVLIGGSGGGHRFSPTLGKDYTHTALEMVLENARSKQLFGKNGHLWCKLVCGKIGGALIINLPGPFVEAKAAMEAFCKNSGADIETINTAMAEAVLRQYPDKNGIL